MVIVNGDPIEPEPVIAPAPTGQLSNYLILYAYPNGQVQFHCSHLDPGLNFELLAVAADALSNACRKMQEQAMAVEQRIHRAH